jgi:RNA recognition motif-containing protein
MNIYVGNLSFDTKEQDLETAFGAYGAVTSAAIIKDKFSGQSRGFAFVEMANNGEAQKAIEAMNGAELHGRNLNVNEARPREERSGGGGGFNNRGGGGGGNRNFGGGGGNDRRNRY